MKTFRVPVLGTTVSVRGKDESALVLLPELKGRVIRSERSPRSIPMGSALTPRDLDLGTLSEDKELRIEDIFSEKELELLSRKVVTNAGVAFMTTNWFDGSLSIANFNAHAHGTGTTAENVTDTALVTEVGTRVAGTKSKPATNQLRTIATLTAGATLAITEQGIFDSTTPSGSTLWDRSVFSAINVSSGDSIQYQYTTTLSAGG